MKKERQLEINMEVKNYFASAIGEIYDTGIASMRRLRTCSATVFETPHYYVLKSYDTYIACIPKFEDVVCDALRYVYGYTSTSAQHVAKFHKDYAPYAERLTYRSV